MSDAVFQRCIPPHCGGTLALADTSFHFAQCRGVLDVAHDWDRLSPPKSLKQIEEKWSRRTDPLCFSGVWRFRDLLPFAPPDRIMTIGEGQTILQRADSVAAYAGV